MITAHAHARAGLVGNPSDGYFGKTISFIIRNFRRDILRELIKLKLCWPSLDYEVPPGYLEIRPCPPSIGPKEIGR